MKSAFRPLSLAWWLITLGAVGFLLWVNVERVGRVEALSALAGWSVDAPAMDTASPTGYAGGRRNLVVPQRDSTAQEWIIQTQQMLARGEWRMRHADYDNAPQGRETHTAAPYRWWLGLIARADHAWTGRPLGLAVERAALLAGPLLHLLLVVGAGLFTAWRFGPFPAALLATGLVTLFPLAGGFLPGVPDHHGLAWSCALGSMLALLAGLGAGSSPPPPGRAVRVWFFVAGLAGGLGLWVNAASLVPILAGTVLGALGAAWVRRPRAGEKAPAVMPPAPSWRAWGLGGAAMSLTGYLIEYAPSQLGWGLEVNHPLYAFAWLGTAELLARTVAWLHGAKPCWRARDWVVVFLALAVVAALPVAIYRLEGRSVLISDPLATRLTVLGGPQVAANMAAWIAQSGFSRLVWATCLPLLLIGPVLGLMFLGRLTTTTRATLTLVLGPTLVALGFAWFQLGWWSLCDGMLLVLLVAATADSGRGRVLWAVALALVVAPGVIGLLPKPRGPVEASLTDVEVEALVERDLAHWLSERAGSEEPVIFAPPNTTATLGYHGGMRGLLGVLAWENGEGMAAAIRIASASTSDEALALIQRRGITHLVIPSWDPTLDEFARLGSTKPEHSLIPALHNWALPFWLRPVPYVLPAIPGFERQSLLVLEVVDEQEPTTALARVAEYFVEINRPDLAAGTQVKLRQYPENIAVLTALARVEASLGHEAGFARTFAALVARLAAQGDDNLAWDRRLSLAMVLARGNRFDLARGQIEQCLAGVDEERLRSLPAAPLFHLQMLAKRFNFGITDPTLQRLARELLPPGPMRDRLVQPP